MHMIIIRFKEHGGGHRDIAVTRNLPTAKRYVETLLQKYPSFQTGEFEFSRSKLIKNA